MSDVICTCIVFMYTYEIKIPLATRFCPCFSGRFKLTVVYKCRLGPTCFIISISEVYRVHRSIGFDASNKCWRCYIRGR